METLHTLPLEVQFEIFSYLLQPLSSHAGNPVPVTPEEQRRTDRLRQDRHQLMLHPYNNLAATCQQLRSSVEAHCLYLLKGHHGSRFKVPKPPKDDWNTAIALATVKGTAPKLPSPHRIRYLRNTFEKCIFCGKRTTRRAAFNRFMWCDKKCDLEHFGRLISKSEAQNTYKVLELHWRTPQLVFPESTWKPLRMTLYNTSTCPETTLLREKDIIEMADYIKVHDPRGDKLKLARKRIRDKERLDKAKALIKQEEEFMKFAGSWLSNSATSRPSPADCTRAASFVRSMVQDQLLRFDKDASAAAKKKSFQGLLFGLPPSLKRFCKVEILHLGDQIIYRFGISRPAPDGNEKAESLYIPIIFECDSRRGQS